MGLDSLRSSGVVQKILYFLLDRTLTPPSPLRKVRKSRILLFVGVQLLGFGIAFGITQTTAAIGFPVVILLLVPLRSVIVPKLPFTEQELAILDGPTASPFVSHSCLESSTKIYFVGRLWNRLEGQYRLRRAVDRFDCCVISLIENPYNIQALFPLTIHRKVNKRRQERSQKPALTIKAPTLLKYTSTLVPQKGTLRGICVRKIGLKNSESHNHNIYIRYQKTLPSRYYTRKRTIDSDAPRT